MGKKALQGEQLVNCAVPEWDPSFGEDDWSPTDVPCPQCGKLVWEIAWFDDPPFHGGACVGVYKSCETECGWYENY